MGRYARICPTERSKISLLEDNSLEMGTGNFIAQNREFIETSREFAASCRELPSMRAMANARAIVRDARSVGDGKVQQIGVVYRQIADRPRRLKPGTVLLREYQASGTPIPTGGPRWQGD